MRDWTTCKTEDALQSISALEQLERLAERLGQVKSWKELLSP